MNKTNKRMNFEYKSLNFSLDISCIMININTYYVNYKIYNMVNNY